MLQSALPWPCWPVWSMSNQMNPANSYSTTPAASCRGTGLPDGGIRGGFADQRGFVYYGAQHRQGWPEDAAKGGWRKKFAVDANFVDIPAAGHGAAMGPLPR